MTMAMISLTILPFMAMMTMVATNAKATYIQSTRSLVLNSLMDEATGDRDNFAPNYNQASMDTSTYSESGTAIPTLRAVDTTNASATDTFQKTLYYYLYNKTSDPLNAPLYQTQLVLTRSTMRVRSNTTGWVDSSYQWWEPYNTYSAGNVVPGLDNGAPTNKADATAIVNLPSHNDALLYQSATTYTNTTWSYAAPVSNGLYTVKLYFVEPGASGRLMDISIEGTLMNSGSPYNAYVTCGNRYYCGNVQMYDVNVTDGTINIQIVKNASATTNDPYVSALMIKKRT